MPLATAAVWVLHSPTERNPFLLPQTKQSPPGEQRDGSSCQREPGLLSLGRWCPGVELVEGMNATAPGSAQHCPHLGPRGRDANHNTRKKTSNTSLVVERQHSTPPHTPFQPFICWQAAVPLLP